MAYRSAFAMALVGVMVCCATTAAATRIPLVKMLESPSRTSNAAHAGLANANSGNAHALSWMGNSEMGFAAPMPAMMRASRRPVFSAVGRRPQFGLRMSGISSASAASALKPIFEKESTAQDRVKAFNDLKEQGVISKWGSAELRSRPVTQNELKRALKTESDLDQLLGLAEVSTDLKGLTVAAFGASAVIGVGGSIIGGDTGGLVYWITYLGASLPLVLIGVGSVAPGLIGDLVGKIQWKLDPTNTRERRVRHEAAHMMCGYLCGLPIQGYQVEPDPICQFYDRPEGNYDDIEKWKKQRPFSEEEVDVLAVVSLSGLMGELTKYDTADGGQQDLVYLQDVFFKAEGDGYRKNRPKEEQTRWGALRSNELINENKDAFERLVAAMERGASVHECVAVIEGA